MYLQKVTINTDVVCDSLLLFAGKYFANNTYKIHWGHRKIMVTRGPLQSGSSG